MGTSSIEWTEITWNPTTGCDRVSPGCDNCYALTLANRLKAMGQAKYQNDGDPGTSGPGFAATEHETELEAPLRWTKPSKVFVNSMSDLFHQAFSDEFIAKAFVVMALTPQHVYQVLTKRHGRMRSLLNNGERWHRLLSEALSWAAGIDRPIPHERFTEARRWLYGYLNGSAVPLPNVWLGVSVENQQWADIRIPALLHTPAAVRFLSCEPLLGPVDLSDYVQCGADWLGHTCNGCTVDWVIVGGESGRHHRMLDLAWVRDIRDHCVEQQVPFFFKQVGGLTPKAGGRLLDGRTWNEYPAVTL